MTVSEGIRLKAWKTNPIRSRRRIVSRRSLSPARSVSPSATVPDVGRSSPAATCRNVLLPEPDGPMMAVNDPRENPTLTPSRATTAAVALAMDLADVAKGDRGSGDSGFGDIPGGGVHEPAFLGEDEGEDGADDHDARSGWSYEPGRCGDRGCGWHRMLLAEATGRGAERAPHCRSTPRLSHRACLRASLRALVPLMGG